MNYFGKFDATVSDALGQHPSAHLYSETVHAKHLPSDAVVVPDVQLLFGGEFKRTGVDLVLSGHGREYVVHDYFKGEKHAPLASPDGAHLTGDIVTALAGQVQYAQASGATGGGQVIGHVTKLVGTATAIRNGVSIILNDGDNVEKGDVVSSGSGSTLGITFIDGTVFGLSSNARMVLNEMVYDPNGSNNSSLLSLVAGTITFVAGETAKHGDMKVDTPVATMGIRGTAVLFGVHFKLPNGSFVVDDLNPPPDAVPEGEFQVLVEPDGTTGSYILFDKATLTPLAVVDKAGTQINITNGLMSQTTTPLSPEIQKLITDVFSLKFSDSSNTKSIEHFTDTIIPNSLGSTKFALDFTPPSGSLITTSLASAGATAQGPQSTKGHIPLAPSFIGISDGSLTELANTTGSATPDKTSGLFQFHDVNVSDQTTVSVTGVSYTYTDGSPAHNDITAKLNALQIADIKAAEKGISVAQGPALDADGNGSAVWTYKMPDGAFDFLGAGEKLTLTFTATVDNNYQPFDQSSSQTFTITITGTNDVPVISTPQVNVNFASAGTDTKGGELIPNTATSGTLAFADPDLTDTHTVGVEMTSALLDGNPLSATVGQNVINELAAAMTVKIAAGHDSTGTGTGSVDWTLADLEVYLADLVPAGETLVLTYEVTVTDSQGATSTKDIVVTIGGNLPPATVWIDTNPIPPGGAALWETASNWETDKVPTASDDVFIGTDQVLPGTPTFPATVDIASAAKSLTMDYFSDFGAAIPELDITSTGRLTITDALKLGTSTNGLSPSTAEVIIKNFGYMSVGGAAELLKHSVFDNYGTLVLGDGGDFKDQSSITNSGTIELQGGTLDLEVGIANSGGKIQVDAGATLALSDGATITSGNLAFEDSSAKVTVGAGGATLDGVTVSGDGEIDISTTLTVKDTVTLEGATIDGGKIDDAGLITGFGTIGSVISGLGALTASGGTLTLTGENTYSGVTTISGTLVLSGSGSIADSSDVIDNGTFDITGVTASGTSITTLSGNSTGEVHLGSKTLTLTNANDTFAGVIDGTGGLTVDGPGTETLSGINTYSGATTIGSGETLALSGSGSIADSSGVADDGTLDITGLTASGTSIVTLSGTGNVNLGVNTLTLTAGAGTFAGVISGSGGLTVDGIGTETLSGVNTYSGATTIGSGETLALSGAGSIAASSGVADDGTFDISGTTSGASIKTLSGTGNVNLGSKTLTLTDASTTFSGSFDSTNGEIMVAAGTLTLATMTLDDLTLAGSFIDSGTLTIDDTVTLSDATISGGTLDISGILKSTGTSAINGTTVVNSGNIDVVGGTLTIDPTLVTNTGTIEVEGKSTLVLDDDAITNSVTTAGKTDNGLIQVDLNGLLTLDGTTIDGGIVTNLGGTIDVTAASSISDTFSFANSGTVKADGAAFTLDGVTVDNTGGTIETIGNSGLLKLVNSTINLGQLSGKITTASGNTSSTLNGVTLMSGTVTALAGILELSGIITNNGEFDATTGTLDLDSATINGGTFGGGGTIATASSFNTLSGVTILHGATVTVADNTTLELKNTITDVGTIALGASGHATELEISGNVLLTGGGNVTMTDNVHNSIVSDGSAATLTNHDIISGAGTIGDSHLTLVNDGTIDATGSNKLIINTSVTNDSTGVLEASAGDTLEIDGNVINNGLIEADSSSASKAFVNITGNVTGTGNIDIFSGAKIEIGGSVGSTETVFFEGNAAELILGDSSHFSGLITGATLGAILKPSDQIDLKDLSFSVDEMQASVTYDAATNTSTVIFSDGVAGSDVSIHLSGNYTVLNWQFADDGSGGTVVELAPFDEWTSTSSGLWNDASNWSDGVPPTAGENVVIDQPGTYTVTLTSSVEIDNLFLGQGVTLAISPNATFTTLETLGSISGTGTIDISNKAILEITGSVSGQIVNGAFVGTTVVFGQGQGSLVLDHSAEFHGLISGHLVQDDTIDLKDLAFTATMSDTVSYDSAANISTVTFSNGTSSVSLMFSGNDTNWAFAEDSSGHTIVSDPPTGPELTIDSGTTLDISGASASTVSFTNASGNTGELVLNDSKDFTGAISGFAGDGTIANSDLIDVTDLKFADVATSKTTYTDHGNGTGTLTLYDANGNVLENLNFSGSYQLANFTIEDDGSGNTLIVDPPVTTPVSTTVATNQNSSGTASDGFAFNFTNKAPANDPHPSWDASQFGGPILTNLHTAANNAPEPAPPSMPVAGHDLVGLTEFAKAQLNAHDFHFV